MIARLVTLAAATLVGVFPAAAGAQEPEAVVVTIEPGQVVTEVGVDVTLTVRVENRGPTVTPSLVIHIDVTSPSREGSVDPEDWVSTLTRRVGPLEPGAASSVDWTLKPISGGNFRAYVVALPETGGDEVWVSNGVELDVNERRTLNPEGVAPVAIAAPVIVGVLLISRLDRFRRRR